MQEQIIQSQEPGEPVKEAGNKKIPKNILIATLATFALSTFSAYVFKPGVYLWYIAAGASVISPILFLLWGAITFKKGGSNLMRFALLFFVVALVVGAGTCYLNLVGM